MRLLTTILLLTTFSAGAQSIDSILMVRFSKVLADSIKASDIRYQRSLKDSIKANEVVLDSSQFEIVNKVIRIKAGLLAAKVTKVDSVTIPPPEVKTVNLLTYPDQFDSYVWEKSNGSSILADQIIGPDSLKSADIYSTIPGQWKNLLRRQYNFKNVSYTQTVYLKKNNHDFIGMRISNSVTGTYTPFVNLSTLAVNTVNIPGVKMTAEQLKDGWVKAVLTFTPVAGQSYLDVSVTNSTGNSAWIAKGTEKVYIGREELTLTPVQTIIKVKTKK